MYKKIFYGYIFYFLVFVMASSCTMEEHKAQTTIDLSKMDLSGLNFDFNPVIIDLKEYSLDNLIADLSREIQDNDLNRVAERLNLGDDMEPYIEYSLVVDYAKNIAILTAKEDGIKAATSANRISSNDDALFGGEDGDGWTSYGSCLGSECVAEQILAAADQMGGEPESGQCFDFRVRRLLVGVRVCARTVSCG
ncbi:hypothetical protein [Algoriphagus yeomjeoni]|uniref:Uncharacterized protein n=1 Tax=Algoriphagus yeomjeoni TaxID=291403 RepID=A0A327P7P2_9BACT|nr:hypothetical protein [Algoriphagus yeomjeoni]RAI88285.1 hypothetical protein LV83_02585 [Algoriphagus yeomjeoni]